MGVRPFERIQTLRKSGPTVFINEYSTSAALSAQTPARTGPRAVPAPAFHDRLRPRFRCPLQSTFRSPASFPVFKQYEYSRLDLFLPVAAWKILQMAPNIPFFLHSLPHTAAHIHPSHHNQSCLSKAQRAPESRRIVPFVFLVFFLLSGYGPQTRRNLTDALDLFSHCCLRLGLHHPENVGPLRNIY